MFWAEAARSGPGRLTGQKLQARLAVMARHRRCERGLQLGLCDRSCCAIQAWACSGVTARDLCQTWIHSPSAAHDRHVVQPEAHPLPDTVFENTASERVWSAGLSLLAKATTCSGGRLAKCRLIQLNASAVRRWTDHGGKKRKASLIGPGPLVNQFPQRTIRHLVRRKAEDQLRNRPGSSCAPPPANDSACLVLSPNPARPERLRTPPPAVLRPNDHTSSPAAGKAPSPAAAPQAARPQRLGRP